MDPRVGSIEFPSINLNSSYQKLWCTWTATVKAPQQYYVEIDKLVAHNAHNGTKLCLHINYERKTCQRGVHMAKLPVAVTTETGNLNIRVDLTRGDSQNTCVTFTGRYTKVRTTTHLPGQATTAVPSQQTGR